MIVVSMYDCRTEGNNKITNNFKVREFKSKDSNIVCVSKELVDCLQKIRDKVGKQVIITSAYRTESHNKKVGGASKSKHLYGMAADIYVPGMEALKLARLIESIFHNKYGIIAYTKKAFVHFDVRDPAYRGIDDGTLRNVNKF